MSSSTSSWEPPSPEELQRMLPQYEITDILGRGGMGAVYKGRQSNLDREVAIKVLPETFTKGDDELNFAARFKQEARAMAKLDHPAILSVYDFGETAEGQLYFIMEFIDGMDIQQYLHHHGGKLPQEQALSITAHVLDALDYAHSHGIVHRDIKPANILLNREGRVKIADFGLAKKLEEAGGDSIPALTMTNVAVGTPDFVAPEALDSDQKPDHRADLYAVGVMLYQMLTGKLPRGQFKSPSELDPTIDPRLDEIVSKAMQSHPDDRYSSASLLRADLDVIFSQPFAKVEAGEESAVVAAVVPVTTSVKGGAAGKGGRYAPATPERSKLPVVIGIATAAVLIVGLVVLMTKGTGTGIVKGGLPPVASADVVEQTPAAGKPEVAPAESIGPPTETSAENADAALPTVDAAKPVTPPVEEAPVAQASPPVTAVPVASAETTSESPSGEGALGLEPSPSEKTGGTPVLPPTADSPPPTESPNEAPNTKNEELLSLPGLKTRLDGYHTARRNQLGTLAAKYLGGLDARLNQAADAGDLRLATAFEAEKTRVEALQAALSRPPADSVSAVTDTSGVSLPALPEGSPEPLVTLRQTWTNESAKIRATLDDALQQSLQTLEAELTRARDFDSATTVLAWREALKAGEGRAGTPARNEAGTQASPMTETASDEAGRSARVPSDLATATKDKPFENSLGMKFVPVPGTEVLFCIHETRYRDYEEFAKRARETVDGSWKNQTHSRFEIKRDADDHPVTMVSWDDAKKFCAWLSEKEGKTYRLPTDREWSIAVGIGDLEIWDADTTPETISKIPDVFPWGTQWPPPPRSGNFGDESRKTKAPSESPDVTFLEGYDDGFPTTAPVMSYPPNDAGLFDLSGNVVEAVEDWFDSAMVERAGRGGGWGSSSKTLASSHRHRIPPATRNVYHGFRIVLETGAPPAAPAATSAPANPAAASAPSGPLKNPFGWQPIPKNPFPLPRPTRPTTPCRVVAWRLDGQPVDEAAFRKDFGGVPADLGEVVDLSAQAGLFARFLFPITLLQDGRVVALNQLSNQVLPTGLKPSVAIDGGRDIALALHEDGSVSPLFLAQSAIDERQDLVSEVVTWKDVSVVSSGPNSYAAIQHDGTPLITGTNSKGNHDIPVGFRSSIVFIQPNTTQTWLAKLEGDSILVHRIGESPNLRPKLALDRRFFISSLYYSSDERGRIDFCNSATSPASHENLRGTTRDVRDIVCASHQVTGIAALREGEDQWRFWGDRKDLGGFDTKYCETKAAGCWKLYFIGDYVLALKPVANLKPDDWTGASAP